MGNKIHRVLMSVYCTLMLSSAFLGAGDGYFMAGAVGGLQALEASVQEKLSALDGAGFQNVPNILAQSVQHANGARVSPSASLQPIVAALKALPEGGTVTEQLANDLGLYLKPGESKILMRQRGLKNGGVTRVAQIPADDRAWVMFVVIKEDEMLFFVSAFKGDLIKAARSVPSRREFKMLPLSEAEAPYADQIAFWERKLGRISGTR